MGKDPVGQDTRTATLLAFSKVLADSNRLKIVGLLAQQPHTVEQLAALLGVGSPTVSHHLSAFDRKVLGTFTDETGAITAFLAQQKKYAVLLRHVLGAFESGVRYPEKWVNDTLARFNADTARLRRSLVEHGLMAREGGGGDYWRL